jgi:hypothetical protein
MPETPAKPPPPDMSYAGWRRRARELVTVPTTMGERDWRKLFITGRTPEDAAKFAEAYYTNTQARPKGRR